MGEIRENLKKNLGYYLSLKGISQKELADKLGVSQSSVTNWIKGNNSPDIDIVSKLCEVLDITVIDLFGTDESNNYTEHEKKLIYHYRAKSELQEAVDILLGINES